MSNIIFQNNGASGGGGGGGLMGALNGLWVDGDNVKLGGIMVDDETDIIFPDYGEQFFNIRIGEPFNVRVGFNNGGSSPFMVEGGVGVQLQEWNANDDITHESYNWTIGDGFALVYRPPGGSPSRTFQLFGDGTISQDDLNKWRIIQLGNELSPALSNDYIELEMNGVTYKLATIQ